MLTCIARYRNIYISSDDFWITRLLLRCPDNKNLQKYSSAQLKKADPTITKEEEGWILENLKNCVGDNSFDKAAELYLQYLGELRKELRLRNISFQEYLNIFGLKYASISGLFTLF